MNTRYACCRPIAAAAATPDLDELWRIVQQQQHTIQALNEKLDQALASLDQTESKLLGTEAQLAEHAERIDATADVLDETSGGGISVAASWAERTNIGGYGELHYNNLDDDATRADGDADDLDRVDFHRFVLFAHHEFNDWLRLSTEVEIEHSVTGDGEPGEVELEQVWIEADLNQNHRVRAGLDILPIGLINVTHEPTRSTVSNVTALKRRSSPAPGGKPALR